MPLQTTFGTKVSKHDATQLHDLGTLRIEGNKAYKYYKASGAIADKAAVTGAAAGTVKLHAASLTPIAVNWTGSAFADGEYGWFQVAGQVGPLDTSGATAVGYPLYAVDATGLLTGLVTGATAIGSSVVTVDNATGYGELAGLV